MASSRIISIPDEFWNRLEISIPTGDEWRVSSVPGDVSDRLLGGISSTGNRAFLIALREGEDSLNDAKSRGVFVRTVNLSEKTEESGRYIIIECIDPTGHPLFDLIASDLAKVLITSSPALAVTRVLGKWRRFWGQAPRTILNREEQIGLFAELWFFLHWMLPATDLATAISRWRGPLGALRDFEWPGHAVEVKSSTVVNGSVFRISSIDQLDAGSDMLWLFGLRLREDASSPLNLPDLVSYCVTEMEEDPDSQVLFENILAQAGYSRAFESEYRQLLLRIVDAKLYQVTDEFPKLIPSMLINPLPGNVSEVKYAIDVGNFTGPAFTTPEKAAAHFQ